MKKNRKNNLKIASIVLIILILLLVVFTIVTYNKELNERQVNIDKIGMKFIIEDNEYVVRLSNNNTTIELLDKLPFETDIAKYEDSLYIARVFDKLTLDGEKVSEVKKNHIYYHPGWEARQEKAPSFQEPVR